MLRPDWKELAKKIIPKLAVHKLNSGNDSVVARPSLWDEMSLMYISCSKLNFHVRVQVNSSGAGHGNFH